MATDRDGRTQDGMLSSLKGSSRRRRKERVVRRGASAAPAGVSMLVSVGIVLALLFRS